MSERRAKSAARRVLKRLLDDLDNDRELDYDAYHAELDRIDARYPGTFPLDEKVKEIAVFDGILKRNET